MPAPDEAVKWHAISAAGAGDYPFVTHAFADATKGAVGVFRAKTPALAAR